VRQAVLNLRGQTRDAESFEDSAFDEKAFEEEILTWGSRHFANYYYVAKLAVLVIRDRFAQAVQIAERSAKIARDSRGTLHGAEQMFYHAFALLARDEPMSLHESRLVRKVSRRFHIWAATCPANFRSRERLLTAESERRRGRNPIADYDEAERAAGEFGHLHLQAFIQHRAAAFLRNAGRNEEASVREASARMLFQRWGLILNPD
jgi:hypothetical protein